MTARRLGRVALVLGLAVAAAAIVVGAYVSWIAVSTRTQVSAVSGRRTGLAVDAPVTIGRDARGVVHVRARTDHDLFFAEGYAMAADRLFQMDLTRRYVDGRLSEVLGRATLRADRRMRLYGIRELARRVFAVSPPEDRMVLTAFAEGVNAAAAHEPAPPEYRALFMRFEPWQPEDALAVGFATVLDLDDTAEQIIPREAIHEQLGDAGTDALFPVSDPRYDVPSDNRPPGRIPPLPALHGPQYPDALDEAAAAGRMPADEPAALGSNAWVAGGDRTTTGRAVLANDPHLSVGVPAIWWLFEGRSPGFHIAGAALAGTPGVTLGHDEHVAWGVTAGYAAAMRLVREPINADLLEENGRWVTARHRVETIHVRFGGDVIDTELETPRGVVIAQYPHHAYLMDWAEPHHPVSPLAPFLALNRARTAGDAIAAMRALPEPPLNVVVADDTGRAAYHLAASVPADRAWGRYALHGDNVPNTVLPFDALPHVGPSRDTFVVTSNNRPGGAGTPRLGAYFAPPYRAYEIHRVLAAEAQAHGEKLSVDALAREQSDDDSPAESELAGDVLDAAMRTHAERDASLATLLAAVRSFDGRLEPSSRGATAVVALRLDLVNALVRLQLPRDVADAYVADGPGFEVLLRALRERPRGWVPHDDYDAFIVGGLHRTQRRFGGEIPAFGTWAAQPLAHPLASMGFRAWDGPTLPGRGGSFAPAVQWHGHAQSFRAVWSPGDWDGGTIDIDAGESGEPGSPHYADESARWIAFARTALPFSDAAVRAATRSTLTLSR
jgi:penicillin amidase